MTTTFSDQLLHPRGVDLDPEVRAILLMGSGLDRHDVETLSVIPALEALDDACLAVLCHECEGSGDAVFVARGPSRYVTAPCERCGGTGRA